MPDAHAHKHTHIHMHKHTYSPGHAHAHMPMHVCTVQHEYSAYACIHTKLTVILIVYKLIAAEYHGIGEVEKSVKK
jgi:hypothetical protein